MGVPTQTSRWIYDLDTVKSSYAHSIKTPKLLLVSGSNTLYGISCQMIQEETGVPCINTALTQELGLDYILTHARTFAKAGDTILMPLEYQLYTSDGKPSDLLIDYVFAYAPDYLKSTKLLSQIRLVGGISFERLTQGMVAKFKPLQLKNTDKSRINQNGDVTDNGKDKMAEDQYNAMAAWNPFNLGSYKITNYSKKEILKFIYWCKKNNINIVSTWPSTVSFDAYQQPKSQDFFQSIEDFYQSIHVPVIGTPRDFLYDKSLFFNSTYHLNDVGRCQRTRQIIELIKPYLNSMADRT